MEIRMWSGVWMDDYLVSLSIIYIISDSEGQVLRGTGGSKHFTGDSLKKVFPE